MFPRIFIVIFLSITPALAAECSLWSIRGKIIYEAPAYYLLSAEGTQSETRLRLPVMIQHKLIEHQDKYIEASVVLREDQVPKIGTIIDVKGSKRIIPDPLRENAGTVFKKTGVIKCP